MSMLTDHYKYAGLLPVQYNNIKDDVSEIIEHCNDLAYDYYLYGGLVMQLQPKAPALWPVRFFVSFTITNDGYQHFVEASSLNMVINAQTCENPLQDFLNLMKESITPKVGT